MLFSSPDSKDLLLYPLATWGNAASVVAGAVVTTLVSALYPAYRASLLTPVEALRGGA